MEFEISRRDFVKAASAASIAGSLPAFGFARNTHPGTMDTEKEIGAWSDDAAGLPRYTYTGSVPFPLSSEKITREYLPVDPFFLIGNYRFTLFAHVSGIYEILSAERAWGRLNQGAGIWSGANHASVTIGGKAVPLVGLAERAAQTAEKTFGVGYAQYRYSPAPDLRVTRTLSVMPSQKAGDGTSAFVLSVALRNEGLS